MAKIKTKQAIEPVAENPIGESGETTQVLPIIIDPTPIPPAPPKSANPFAFSDIKDVVRVAAGFQCAVKFNHHDDYLAYLACAEDVEEHGRAIHAACVARASDGVPDYFPTDAELLEAVQDRASRELRRATSEVTKYQDRVDIDDASEADIAMLRAWKTYRAGLNRLPDQVDYPHHLTWPVAPDRSAL
ncbi:virus tail fibre assembly protein, lambda gpK [Collimonas sp. OK607]|uniref:tail fiber assembly protein n=1 Tax=Collimonas sp. OK607 TaxID=1798194 RepID=UPI0008E0CAF7|nr:tail fiber assembly protein [Collimonas sp. OK607]SFB12371.1 virus tail fibre assembly protein, lambda gpK [Collimonas sp. OK607]